MHTFLSATSWVLGILDSGMIVGVVRIVATTARAANAG